MAIPLVIGTEEQQAIEAVKQYAESHKFNRQTIETYIETGRAIGDDANLTCVLPFGFRCCFSVEEQPEGWCYHLSVSLAAPGRVPSVPAVKLIMEEFGFPRPIPDEYTSVFIEREKAVNIVQLIELPKGAIS